MLQTRAKGYNRYIKSKGLTNWRTSKKYPLFFFSMTIMFCDAPLLTSCIIINYNYI